VAQIKHYVENKNNNTKDLWIVEIKIIGQFRLDTGADEIVISEREFERFKDRVSFSDWLERN
jgi:hypothetical protein